MPERPLLVFPTPQQVERTKKGLGASRLHKPGVARQGKRLSPMFIQLQAAFEARRVELQQTAAGVDPQQVLVMETIGSVEGFLNAVKRIEGLEWMGELEIDEIAPDEDFYDEQKPEKQLNGRLYLIMTNQRALNELLSLWKRYQNDPDMQFERGLTKFRDVFLQLKSIRQWDVEDRLLETGIIDSWKQDLAYDGNRVVLFEAELWFRGSEELRTASANQVTRLVQQEGGRVLSQSVIEAIAYHGILAELPANAIRSIIETRATELVKCEAIMFFRPVGQMVVGDASPDGDVEISRPEEMPLPAGDPVVALLDGVPLTNHALLAERLIVDDPDNWEASYQATERIHGTAMASLIIHGDLNEKHSPLSRPIYVRPIMRPGNGPDIPRREGVPEDCLVVDLIHRAVKRLFEGDGSEGPVAPMVRVVNLSVGDPYRPFAHMMSPLARLLDWLSVKYGVLFIVSAGNHPAVISLDVSREEFESLPVDDLEAATIKALYRDARHRRLLSPAETINGLTVGAVHFDEARVPHQGDRIEPFVRMLPSPVSAFGSGYRRSIKPDLIYRGGRQWYRLLLERKNFVAIRPTEYRSPPGNRVATPGPQTGDLNAIAYCRGTSNATALISRAAGICYDTLHQIFQEQAADLDLTNFEAPLLKAMLVHGCSWGDTGSRIAEVLGSPAASPDKGLIARWIGYGIPEVERVLDCTEQRATVLGCGHLSDGEAHVFSLPLPPSLASRPEWRRLTVTLAWLSPISANTQKYRTAGLWFEMNSNFALARSNADWQAVRRGTVQHEVFEGQKAVPFIDGEAIEIKVNCRKDAGKIQEPVAYGLAVSLEVAEGVDIAVYNEIRTRIAPAIQIRQTTGQDEGQ